jgi:peptidoglycan/LPS O-acetylase OafA/YrhL
MVTSPTVQPVQPADAPSPCPNPFQPKAAHRITGLDSLRGLAAFSVLLGHYTANYHRLYHHSDKLLFSYPWAAYGVTLFFMISGFVILMTAERVKSPLDFAWARFSRLYPAYWTAVLLTFTVLTVFTLPGRQPTVPRMLVNLTMFQNLLGVGSIDGVYWTLHVELYFYAMMFLLLCAGRVRFTEFLLLGLVCLSVADELLLSGVNNEPLKRLRNVLILDNAFAFAIGVLLYRSIKAPRWWHPLAVAGCLAYALFFKPRTDFYVSAALAGLMYLTTRGWLTFLNARPLVFLGTISYSLYLTHQNIGYVVIRAGYAAGLNPNVSIALAAAAALSIAAAITFLVERPAMSFLRDRRPKWLSAPSPRPARPDTLPAAA